MVLETGQFWIFLATFILSFVIMIWKMGSWAGSVNSRLDSLNSRIEALEQLALEFREDIKKLFFAISPAPVGASSPIQLTPAFNNEVQYPAFFTKLQYLSQPGD